MPIYEYECACGNRRERYLNQSEAAAVHSENLEDDYPIVFCETCGAVMDPVMSAPAPHQVGGADGKLRTGEKIKQRNDAYHRSPRGQEAHRANIDAARRRGLPA